MKPVQLSIPEPCHQNWNQMLPEAQGKFCLSCQKTVVDFTAMSDREVLNFFSNNTGNTCGRFNDDQLNKTLSVPKERSIGKWKYFWQFLLPAVFAMHKAEGQKTMGKPAIQQEFPVKDSVKKVTNKPAPTVCQPVSANGVVGSNVPSSTLLKGRIGGVSVMPVKKIDITIQGKIVDGNGVPLQYVNIASEDKRSNTITDSFGNFTLKMKDYQSITISYVGYEPSCVSSGDFIKMDGFEIAVKDRGIIISGVVIPLKTYVSTGLAEVVVVGYAISRRLTGDVVVTSCGVKGKKAFFNFFKKQKAEPTQTHLKIYPNPITPGQQFKVDYKVAKQGDYLLQIIDVSGKLVHTQTIYMKQLQQTETIDGHNLHQSGTYIIQLSNGEKNIVFNGKLVVQ